MPQTHQQRSLRWKLVPIRLRIEEAESLDADVRAGGDTRRTWVLRHLPSGAGHGAPNPHVDSLSFKLSELDIAAACDALTDEAAALESVARQIERHQPDAAVSMRRRAGVYLDAWAVFADCSAVYREWHRRREGGAPEQGDPRAAKRRYRPVVPPR